MVVALFPGPGTNGLLVKVDKLQDAYRFLSEKSVVELTTKRGEPILVNFAAVMYVLPEQEDYW